MTTTTTTNACLTSINGFLSAPYTGWFPVVMAVALAVLGVLSMLYIISPIVGRSDIRTWIRFKIVDVFLSIIFILIFAGFASATCTVNPASFFQQYGLLPTYCQSAQTINGVAVPVPNNLYSISLCDIYTFSTNSYNAVDNVLFGSMILFSFWPSFSATIPPHSSPDPGLGIGFALSLPVPFSSTLGTLLGGIYSLQILNQIQLILIATAPLLFAIFMSIGLIARIFGITRTFGGAMIAFGIGLGIVYPFLVAVTYGFLGVTISSVGTNIASSITSLGSFVSAAVKFEFTGGLAGANALASNTLVTTAMAAFPNNVFYQLLEYVGLAFTGMLFIPFINFLIIDAFIVDFSKAVGEKMDFLSMIQRLL